ncbi:MAG: 3-isopropylmalate dehydrogenase [Spirochaetota bacterium]|jgi:hypothetical protein|nr:3-isopropylmalate dehydrogenase [Spirochaetota bacterium]
MAHEKDSGKHEKLLWHQAFYDAIRLELYDYRDDLEYAYEHQITSEPMRIDVLIVKKKKDVIIDKSIARIFRGHNIIEYKSPGDYFSVRDFLQVCAYACNYAANTLGVDYSDVSLTFVGARHPRALLHYLTEERKYTVAHPAPGIYLITGDYLPIQILESPLLPKSENLWLRSLSKNLRVDAASVILEKSKDDKFRMYTGAYLDILIRANPKTFLEAKNMAKRLLTREEALNEIFPELRQRREEGKAEAEEKIARNLLAEGMPVEQVARLTELSAAQVQALKKDT